MRCLLTGLVFALGFLPASRATTYLVTPDGGGDYPAIQVAITAVANGDTILLGDGVFTGSGNWDIEGLGKAIALMSLSGNPEDCVIDCQGWHRAFDFRHGEEPDFILAGIRMINGGRSGGGGAIRCRNQSSPTIQHCLFEANNTSESGGALLCDGFSAPHVLDCTFIDNVAYDQFFESYGGGISCTSASPRIKRCAFSGNSAFIGGGFFCTSNSSPTLSECTFEENRANDMHGGGAGCDGVSTPHFIECAFHGNTCLSFGGGLYSTASAHPILDRCTFEANSTSNYGAGIACLGAATISECRFTENDATGGGGALLQSEIGPNATLERCTFEGNSAHYGGALAIHDAQPTILSCTLYGNSAEIETGGIRIWGTSHVTIERTIVSFSPYGCGVSVAGASNAVLTCCDIYGNAAGDWIGFIEDQYGINGNIAIDPLFCDAGNADFTLHSNSPCAPFTEPNPECDLIGAWPVGCGVSGIAEELPGAGIFLSQPAPNPLFESTRFAFRIPAGSAGARLQIHDALGRLVRTWLRNPGMQAATWDGRDAAGRHVPAGIYYLRLNVGNESARRTITVIR